MIREAEAIVRKQRFLLCRYALIFATGAVGFLETAGHSPIPIAVLVALAMWQLHLGAAADHRRFSALLDGSLCCPGMAAPAYSN